MPSTNLPGDSLKGTAGFRYFPGGSTSVAESVHTLNWPAELVPGGGASYRANKFRSPVQSLDLEHREVWTIGSGREEATLRIRFDDWPESLMSLLSEAADGVTVDYYPRLASTNLKFPVNLLDVDARIMEDEDRFAQAEYEADLRIRDASTDAQGFWWLKNDNKLKNPRLARGTTDGVAEEWSANTGVSSYAIEERAQKIIKDSTDDGLIVASQVVRGALPGDVWQLSVEARTNNTGSILQARVVLQARDSGGSILKNWPVEANSTAFERISVTSTGLPSGTARLDPRFQLLDTSTGDDSTGVAWYRDAKLTLS